MILSFLSSPTNRNQKWQLLSPLLSLWVWTLHFLRPVPQNPHQKPSSSSPKSQTPNPQSWRKSWHPEFKRQRVISIQASCNKPSSWSNRRRPRGNSRFSPTPSSSFWAHRFFFPAYLRPDLRRRSCLGPSHGAPLLILASSLSPLTSSSWVENPFFFLPLFTHYIFFELNNE